MKFRLNQILAALFLILLFAPLTALAQTNDEQKKEESESTNATGKFTVRLFEIKHQTPTNLQMALDALRSGTKGSQITANNQLRTLTVRDYLENVQAIERALARLDVPEQSPVSLEFQLHLLSASMVASERPAVPKNLEPVVAQLQSTLKFSNYRYISSVLNRVNNGGKIESSGVTGSLFPTPAGVASTPENPSFYRYGLTNVKLTQDASGKDTVQIDLFNLSVSVPVRIGQKNDSIQYRDIGLVTPLTLREGEIAVVGTANISGSDEAIIIIVSVKKVK